LILTQQSKKSSDAKRHGMVLGVVVMIFLILSVFFFSYNRWVRQQNLTAHQAQIGSVAEALALSGANLIAEQMTSGVDKMIDILAPALKNTVMVGDPAPPITVTSASILGHLKSDLNEYFFQLDKLVFPLPSCKNVSISFDQIRQLTPSTDAGQLQVGRDPCEKVGELTISCTVEYQDLIREAIIRRQFRVVSMVPGPFARFSLFVPFTPYRDSYNAMGVQFNGTIDSTYSHPYPSGKNLQLKAPLVITNGLEKWTLQTQADAERELANRGWIFLGPSIGGTTQADPVLLKIPAGYTTPYGVSGETGGHFMIALPPDQSISGQSMMPMENITDSANFSLNPKGVSCAIHGMYQGFFTADPRNPNGAIDYGLWADLDDPNGTKPRSNCASTWLFPFGNADNPSRTLMIGPVLAGILKVNYFKDSANPTGWAVMLGGMMQANYPQPSPVLKLLQSGQSIMFADVFLNGFPSYQKLLPWSSVPHKDKWTGTDEPGVAFNVLYDFMGYPGKNTGKAWSFPDIRKGSLELAKVADPSLVPAWQTMNDATSRIAGVHPHENVSIQFAANSGTSGDDAVYFRGNLSNMRVALPKSAADPTHLLRRTTHIINLSDFQDQKTEDEALAGHLFAPANSSVNPAAAGYLAPKSKGIFFICRRKNMALGDKLRLPGGKSGEGGLFIDQNLIVIVDKGDLLIPNEIKSNIDPNDGTPEKLFSLVALDGDIYLGTSKQIQAYLVALKPHEPASGNKPGGRLLGDGVTKMNIFGGVAVTEMGLYTSNTVRTTMEDFVEGGSIKYNPRFNPGSPTYASSREFILENKNSFVQVKGAE